MPFAAYSAVWVIVTALTQQKGKKFHRRMIFQKKYTAKNCISLTGSTLCTCHPFLNGRYQTRYYGISMAGHGPYGSTLKQYIHIMPEKKLLLT